MKRPETTDIQKINRLNQKIINADNSGDLNSILTCYTDDVVWLPPDGQQIIGIEKVEERYRQLYKLNYLSIDMAPQSLKIDDYTAISYGHTKGTVTSKKTGEITQLHDTYLMVYQRQDDVDWKVSMLMWNNVMGENSSD